MPDDRFGKGTSSTTKATKKGIENIIKQANTAGSQQFLSGNVSASDRRDQITDLANLAQNRGVDFNLNTEEFTGNERGISNTDPTGKLREGMTGDEYHWFMRGLHKANPAAMETAFPFSSGAGIRNIATALTPLKYLKALGSGAKEGLGNLSHKLAPGLTEALGFHKKKFMKDLANVGPGLKKEFKKLARLNSTEEANLDIINQEMTSSLKDAQDIIQGGGSDWAETILGDDIKDAENKIMDNWEEILFGVDDTSQTTAYDPTEDLMNIDPYSDRAKRLGLSDTVQTYNPYFQQIGPTEEGLKNIKALADQSEETTEDIFDVSQNRMPHVPITREQKVKAVDEGHAVGPWGDWVGEDDVLDLFYNRMREAQEKGMEYGPWKGVVAESPFEEWQSPGISEIQDQIRWNTANAPLDTNQLYPPELTEDVIKENITTDWGWNKGGYLKKFDDGGYANMSTFEKLKAINDSIAEG